MSTNINLPVVQTFLWLLKKGSIVMIIVNNRRNLRWIFRPFHGTCSMATFQTGQSSPIAQLPHTDKQVEPMSISSVPNFNCFKQGEGLHNSQLFFLSLFLSEWGSYSYKIKTCKFPCINLMTHLYRIITDSFPCHISVISKVLETVTYNRLLGFFDSLKTVLFGIICIFS